MIDQHIDYMLEGKTVSEDYIALILVVDKNDATFFIVRDLSATRQKIVLGLKLKSQDSIKPTVHYLQGVDECLCYYESYSGSTTTCMFLMSDIDICDIVDVLSDVLVDSERTVTCNIKDQTDLSYDNVVKLAYNIGALSEITSGKRNTLKVIMPDNLLLSRVGIVSDFLSIVLEESNASGNIYNLEFVSSINNTEMTLNNIKKILGSSSIFDIKGGINVYLRSSMVNNGMTEIYFSAKDSHHSSSAIAGGYLERHGVMRMIDD